LGGGNTVLPEIHRAAVHDNHWMTDQQFAAIYAIAEAAPGPSSMIVSLVGLKAAGIVGALVAIISILGPSSLLMYVACRTWNRFRDAKWRIAFERGLGPVSLGLLFSSGWTVVKTSDQTRSRRCSSWESPACWARWAWSAARPDLGKLCTRSFAARSGSGSLSLSELRGNISQTLRENVDSDSDTDPDPEEGRLS